MAGNFATTFFKEIDANEDGEITEEEFVEECLRNKIISDFLVDPILSLMEESDSD